MRARAWAEADPPIPSEASALAANKAYRIYGDGPDVSTILFTGLDARIYPPDVGANTLNLDGLTLETLTPGAGTAISATFNRTDFAKNRTASIHNVEIRGSNRTGSTDRYWKNGFYLYKAPNSVIEKVVLEDAKSQKPDPPRLVNLSNGHLDFFADGVRMTNLSAVKVSTVDFQQTNDAAIDGTHLVLTNCIDAIVTDCTLTSQTDKIDNENGVFLISTQQARVSGNIFRNLYPLQTGSPIAAHNGSKTVRVTENIFKNWPNSFDNHIGGEAYYVVDNVIVPQARHRSLPRMLDAPERDDRRFVRHLKERGAAFVRETDGTASQPLCHDPGKN